MYFSLLGRYITRELIKYFAFTFAVMTGLLFFTFSIQVIRRYSNFISLLDIISLAPLTFGKSTVLTIPLALLGAITLLYGRMSCNNEILILRSAGTHFYRILKPVILLGVSLSLLCFYLHDQVIPQTSLKIYEMKYTALERLLNATFTRENATIDYIPNVLIYYRKLQNKTLHQLVIQRLHDQQVVQELLATKGRVEYNKDRNTLTFHLYNGTIAHMKKRTDGTPPPKQYSNEERLFFEYLSFPVYLGDYKSRANRDRTKYKDMSKLFADLYKWSAQKAHWQREIARLSDRDGLDEKIVTGQEKAIREHEYAADKYNSQMLEIHDRFAVSLTTLLVALVGAPLGILIRHSNRLVVFGISALPVVLVYYPLQMMGKALGKQQLLSPFWSAWLGNFCALIIALALLIYVFRK